MSWVFWLGIACVVSVFAVTFLRPRGARHIANTRLLRVGRVILLIIFALLFYLALTRR